LIVGNEKALVLWNVAKQTVVREFPFRIPIPPSEQITLAVAENGSLIGAAARFKNGKGATTVWDVKSGKLVRSCDQYARALALSPDGGFLATSAEDGSISIWSVLGEKKVAHLRRDRAVVMAMAFARDTRHDATAPTASAGWLLAAGDDSGTVTVSVRQRRLVPHGRRCCDSDRPPGRPAPFSSASGFSVIATMSATKPDTAF
jgi:WD40 repeat protein